MCTPLFSQAGKAEDEEKQKEARAYLSSLQEKMDSIRQEIAAADGEYTNLKQKRDEASNQRKELWRKQTMIGSGAGQLKHKCETTFIQALTRAFIRALPRTFSINTSYYNSSHLSLNSCSCKGSSGVRAANRSRGRQGKGKGRQADTQVTSTDSLQNALNKCKRAVQFTMDKELYRGLQVSLCA